MSKNIDKDEEEDEGTFSEEDLYNEISERRLDDDTSSVLDFVEDEKSGEKISTYQTIIGILASVVISVFVFGTNWTSMNNDLKSLQGDVERLESSFKKLENVLVTGRTERSANEIRAYNEFLIFKNTYGERVDAYKETLADTRTRLSSLEERFGVVEKKQSSNSLRIDYIEKGKKL